MGNTNGGKRPGAGRKPGSKSSFTTQDKAQRYSLMNEAKKHTDIALNALLKVVTTSGSDAAIVSAAKELLDRGWGKTQQDIGLSATDGHVVQLQVSDEKLSDEKLRELAARFEREI